MYPYIVLYFNIFIIEKKLKEEVSELQGQFYYKSVDIRNEKNIIECVQWAMSNFGSVDVLVNNAGIYDEIGLIGNLILLIIII